MPSIYQSIDPVGYVKKLDDFYVRKINHQYNNHTLQIIKSGALDTLIDLNLFPKTNIHKKHENIFLYHTKIKYFSIPAEWSFDMLKDVILTMLDVDIILQRFGYTLKDFHFDNICFSNGNIFFIDFGSIIEVTNTFPPCTYFDEFLQYIYIIHYYYGPKEMDILLIDIFQMRFTITDSLEFTQIYAYHYI